MSASEVREGWADLLLGQRALALRPELAVEVGLNEAIVLQQLHWCLGSDRAVELDDRLWLAADLKFWQRQFPWWSESTIRRTFQSLKDAGLVEISRGREANTYSVNYPAAFKMNGADRSKWPPETVQSERSSSMREGEEREVGGEPTADVPLPGLEPPASPTPEPSSDDAKVQEVWDHYVAVFGDRLRVKELTSPRRRILSKALKAVGGNVEVMKLAINGLKSYRTAHPDGSQNVGLDVIFETGPHSRSNLTEQIEWWADQAADEAMIDPSVPSVQRDRIIRRRLLVVEMHQRPDDTGARERGEQALEWLRAHAKEEPVVIDGRVDSWRKVT
jgi:hypothetical protein